MHRENSNIANVLHNYPTKPNRRQVDGRYFSEQFTRTKHTVIARTIIEFHVGILFSSDFALVVQWSRRCVKTNLRSPSQPAPEDSVATTMSLSGRRSEFCAYVLAQFFLRANTFYIRLDRCVILW